VSRRADTDSSLGTAFEALLRALARPPEHLIEPISDPGLGPGSRVGRYEVVELIGRGGMGAVYRARDDVLQRDVALKVILMGAPGSSVDRFRREIVALASVRHENVVSVHDAGVDGALPYVVLDLVEGQTLRKRLQAGALGVVEALKLARDLARGLGAAHSVGIVHRDLKPENILLGAQGTAKIVDFGLARLVDRADTTELGLTESGVLLGTAGYMAPEQVRVERVDHRADFFAVGAVLFEALTGRRAFEGTSRADVVTAVLRDQPAADPALLSDERARHLLGVAFRCLEKTPERRFQSAAELINALECDAPQIALDARPTGEAVGERFVAPPEIPETRYATSSGVHIAYQVVSPPGPPTLVAAPSALSNIEVIWESPRDRAAIQSLASFTHFIQYDRRGVGMSDPIAPECTLGERVDDLRAVLDAEGVQRTFLWGVSEGGSTVIAFAVRYPERARGLILIGTFARLVSGDGYEHGLPREQYASFIDKWVENWGTPQSLSLRLLAPSVANDPEAVRWANRYLRQCASPGTARRLFHMLSDIDVRNLLGRLQCPVLVLHRRGDRTIPVEHGRYLGNHIPGARYLELDGIDHAPYHGDSKQLLDHVREFVVGATREDRDR
jgi:serine/threonine protein kinase